ncbi:hypothetical protein FJT64_011710 [Amphibalanus amphitrite]|uniref:Uncharacterized protein n=1 Tax=Amphibalanus amphitrite TaxID=1232801 RepID=A0A6A4V1G4_AMPAM|nr:hypothetical protein FJT64_011710 [Amphibalanus amphitrite]
MIRRRWAGRRCGLGTPTSSRMGTPCHPDFEPIDCTMMPPAKAASPPNEARGALYGSTEIGSPDLSCLLRDWTERTPEHDGAAYRERSSSSVASSTLLRPSQSGPAEALGLRSSPQIVQSPLALLEPAGHLVVASPLDEDMDQLDVPQAFCKPFLDGPDLLFSNRHLAYPHMDSPVLGHSRQVTRFGKVRFTVFPGVHWARDPRERRRQLAAARGIQSSGRRGKRKLAPKPQNSRCQQRVNRSGGACNRSE